MFEIKDLNKLYDDSEQLDKKLFNRQRANIMLVEGKFYSRKLTDANLSRKASSERQNKLNIQKNYIQKSSKLHVNNLLSMAPGTAVEPRNPTELQDVKSAEINNAVLKYIKEREGIEDEKVKWAEDYYNTGEVFVKIFWDPAKGKFTNQYAPKLTKEGEYELDMTGQMQPDKEQPIFEGGMEIEKIYGYNLLRAPGAKSIHTSPYLIIRKLADKKKLIKTFGGNKDARKAIENTSEGSVSIFNSQKSTFEDTKGQIEMREYYFRPCVEYPKGAIVFTTSKGILWSLGELPGDVYPIEYLGYESLSDSPRHDSPIKHIKHNQANINRIATKQAEHQMTLGDDKIITQAGAKVSNGGFKSGVRVLQVAGAAPTLLPGRTGDHYSASYQSEKEEFNDLGMLREDSQMNSHTDAFALLHQSARNKKYYSLPASKFERFLKRVDEKILALARYAFSEDMVIPVIGKNEIVNISEFKNTKPLEYQIKVVNKSEDADTQIGKYLMFTHFLQYGKDFLSEEVVGEMVQGLPFMNNEKIFKTLTAKKEYVENIMRRLERGEMVEPKPSDNHSYILEALNSRMMESGFDFLAPDIQDLYRQKVQVHSDAKAQELEDVRRAQAGLIPMEGPLVTVEGLRVPHPSDPEKTIPMRLHKSAIEWLADYAEKQGFVQGDVDALTENIQRDVYRKFQELQGMPVEVPQHIPNQ